MKSSVWKIPLSEFLDFGFSFVSPFSPFFSPRFLLTLINLIQNFISTFSLFLLFSLSLLSLVSLRFSRGLVHFDSLATDWKEGNVCTKYAQLISIPRHQPRAGFFPPSNFGIEIDSRSTNPFIQGKQHGYIITFDRSANISFNSVSPLLWRAVRK